MASEYLQLPVPIEGSVLVKGEKLASEQEVAETRAAIIARLHASYLNIVTEMEEFQQQWDANWRLSLYVAASEGLNAGGAAWLDDQKELFTAAFWQGMGRSVKNFVSGVFDTTYIYAKKTFDDLASLRYEDIDNTVLNRAWYRKVIPGALNDLKDEQIKRAEGLYNAAADLSNNVLGAKNKALAIFKHREAIMNLPSLIAAGDTKPIKYFVDTVLMEIDPELAREIGTNENFYLVLTIIDDHDSVLSYLAYLGLMVEAIPPNFYAYLVGKGSAYLLIEVTLLAATAFLSAGTAAAARITMLLARLAGTGVRAVTAASKIKRAGAAIRALMRMLTDFKRAAESLRKLAQTIINARPPNFIFKGKTRKPIHAEKEMIKRDAKCRVCGSSEHSTPMRQRGTVEYE